MAMQKMAFSNPISELAEDFNTIVENFSNLPSYDRYNKVLYLLGDLTNHFEGFSPEQITDWCRQVKNAFSKDEDTLSAYRSSVNYSAIIITRKALTVFKTREQVAALLDAIPVGKTDFNRVLSANFDVNTFQDLPQDKICRLMQNHKVYADLALERNHW